jgi:UDP-glucose 4-epimerase
LPKVLVTGGAGFIGSHVADLFLDKGYEVTVVDDLSTGHAHNLHAKAQFHEISVNSEEFATLVRQSGFDVIAHLAGQMDVRKSVADPISDATINILGTLNLMEAARQSGSRSRLIFTSTGGVLYGDMNAPPHAETSSKDPESPYGVAKLSIEHYLWYYGRVHNMDSISLRFGNAYGPRQDLHGEAGVVAIFCGRILNNRPLTVFGDGHQTRDYIFVDDVARAVWLAATKPLPAKGRLDARAFNIGSGTGTSMVEIAAILQRVAHSNVPVEFAPHRPGEQQESFVDVSKVRKVLGFVPEVSLNDGLARTYAWYAGSMSGSAS